MLKVSLKREVERSGDAAEKVRERAKTESKYMVWKDFLAYNYKTDTFLS